MKCYMRKNLKLCICYDYNYIKIIIVSELKSEGAFIRVDKTQCYRNFM